VFKRLRELLDVDTTGVADGDALTYDAGTETWVPGAGGGGGGAPTDVNYLVGTAASGLSAEIVVGTSPGGELGGTWASPTVDTVHSGSSHASVQSGAEATAAAALASHEADTTNIHGITNTAALALSANVPPNSRTLTAGAGLSGGGDLSADRSFAVNVDDTGIEINSDTLRLKDGGVTSAKIADGTITTGDLAFDPATQAELDAHINDTTDAHAGTSITNTAAGNISATTVQAAINELDTEKQPVDATLTALAAANWAANAVPVGSGADTLSQVAVAANKFLARASTGNLVAKDITDFALTLLDDADASTAQSTLGVSTFVKTLLDDADAATARDTLGVIASLFQSGGAQAIKLDDLATPDDNTDLDATTGHHGLLPKLPGGTTTFLRADGSFAAASASTNVEDENLIVAMEVFL
jgi:hypothetical protein